MIGSLLVVVLWITVGVIYGNGLEWTIHKHVLHRLGRKKGSRWGFHLRSHHKVVKKNNCVDIEHRSDWWNEEEVKAIAVVMLIHIPIYFISPVLFFTIVTYGAGYLWIHRKAHKNHTWAKYYLPWHWDHHLGPRKCVEANWCVTFPLFDYMMRTRVPYYGTSKYYLDLAIYSSKEINRVQNENTNKQ